MGIGFHQMEPNVPREFLAVYYIVIIAIYVYMAISLQTIAKKQILQMVGLHGYRS